ncbi:MAG: hypothetical protein WC584_04380 [Candidatus Pacearchaeota archaeon]
MEEQKLNLIYGNNYLVCNDGDDEYEMCYIGNKNSISYFLSNECLVYSGLPEIDSDMIKLSDLEISYLSESEELYARKILDKSKLLQKVA